MIRGFTAIMILSSLICPSFYCKIMYDVFMDMVDVVLRILFAAAMGGIIGIEREYRDKSAGFRTMILISVGAALFTTISFSISEQLNDVDPARIISYIISGIGFLGAGVIIKDGNSVKGLTTASTIWLSAALGMGAGAGFFTITLFSAFIILFVLIVLPPIEHWIDNRHEFRLYELELKNREDIVEVINAFESNGLRVFKNQQHKTQQSVKLDICADGKPSNHEGLSRELMDNDKVLSF